MINDKQVLAQPKQVLPDAQLPDLRSSVATPRFAGIGTMLRAAPRNALKPKIADPKSVAL
jgi:hypothetical protein